MIAAATPTRHRPLADIVTETLTDGSKAYNVHLRAEGKTVRIAALNPSHAHQIAWAINAGAAWASVAP